MSVSDDTLQFEHNNILKIIFINELLYSNGSISINSIMKNFQKQIKTKSEKVPISGSEILLLSCSCA